MPSNRVMKEFVIKTTAELKSRYLDALAAKGQVPEIAGTRRTSKKSGGSKTLKVNKRGSLSLSKELVAELGFKEGDEIVVRKTKSRVNL
jgi:hypothetical protein